MGWSKGVQVYSWIAIDGYRVQYTVPKGGVSHSATHTWSNDHLEVDSSNIDGWDNYTGPFTFQVYDANNNQIATQTNNINSFSGNLEGGTMTTLENMRSVVNTDCIVTFGYYDAGSGQFGLPKFHECWVTISPNWSNWIGYLAPMGSPQASKLFTTLVLPCAHDVGMNSMSNCMAIIGNAQNVAEVVASLVAALGPVGVAVAGALGIALAINAKDIISGLSITQKDTVSTMLQTGARYFEFRPAHVSSILGGSSPLPDDLYFQHLVIPGISFKQYLNEVITFLVQHPTEIVVTQIRFDGVHSSCTQATDAEIDQYIADALAAPPCLDSIVRAGFDDMHTLTIDAMRTARKRLVVLTHADQYSTYSDGAYATLSGASIEGTYPGFLADASKDESGKQIAVWQCQATSANITEVAVYAALSANSATSTLLCTKPICDQTTLPWLRDNVFPTMPATTLQAVMNDFFDGATADVAVGLSQKYLNQS